jgi:hypothetical protein
MSTRANRRSYDASLHLLDRQVEDIAGNALCNVDDLELGDAPDGAEGEGLGPEVVAILAGPSYLGRRIGGVLGRLITKTAIRIADPRDTGLRRIPFSAVTEIASSVRLGIPDSALPDPSLESWARHHIVSRIPGAEHDPG